jgi:hypothetical protein
LRDFGFTELDEFDAVFLQPERILQMGVPPNREGPKISLMWRCCKN